MNSSSSRKRFSTLPTIHRLQALWSVPGLVQRRFEGRGGRGDDAGPLLHPESPFRHPLHAGRGGLSEINQQLQHAAEILKNTILQSNLRLS